MPHTIAILSGTGQLPVMIHQRYAGAIGVTFAGADHKLSKDTGVVVEHRFERMGELFDDLRQRGVTDIVMAGAMSRPEFDTDKLDPFTANVLPNLAQAMSKGDDNVLRFLIKMIEGQGFHVVGAHELIPELTLPEGIYSGDPHLEAHLRDIGVGDRLLDTLAPFDIGQAVVIEGGLTLGIETLQGTKALLDFVGHSNPKLRRNPRGVLIKRPKTGQDLRVDMPAIGPSTIDQVFEAGLAGIVIAPNRVVVVDRDTVLAKAKDKGVFIWAKDPTC
jgi:DUF1009 family protein